MCFLALHLHSMPLQNTVTERCRAILTNLCLFSQGLEPWRHLESLASARWQHKSSTLAVLGHKPLCLAMTQDYAKGLELVVLPSSSCAHEARALKGPVTLDSKASFLGMCLSAPQSGLSLWEVLSCTGTLCPLHDTCPLSFKAHCS